jgi:hypothetical protein
VQLPSWGVGADLWALTLLPWNAELEQAPKK